ncbi:hypothetical protein [uncultured Holdemanella sp.]|uniref:hypothetical protein n=1 Tax=uncultured Holdemanella sp. TaxID=1763549 RepID=UPI00260098E1|nr:hypothetical protein [uncultured Holdemanella sp.]
MNLRDILELFTNRELAIATWLILFIILISTLSIHNQELRKSIFDVFKTLLSKPLRILIITLVIYFLVVTYLFSILSFWKNTYLKDIVLWFTLSGIYFVMKSVDSDNSGHYIRNYIKQNIQFSIFINFIVSYFTFSYFVELLLQLFLCLLIIFNVFTKEKIEYKIVYDLSNILLVILGLYFYAKAFGSILTQYDELLNLDTFISFLIPFIYMIVFIPLAFFFEVYAMYETLFLRLSFKTIKDKKLLNHRKWEIFKLCKLSIPRIRYFEKNFLFKFYQKISEEEVQSIYDQFLNSYKEEFK